MRSRDHLTTTHVRKRRRAYIAGALGVAAVGVLAGSALAEDPIIESCQLIIEQNATDGDVETVLKVGTTEGVATINVTDPYGGRRLTASSRGRDGEAGVVEFAMETTNNAPNASSAMPEGKYIIDVQTISGMRLRADAYLSLDMPAPPVIVNDLGDSVEVPADRITLQWHDDPAAASYVLEIEQEDIGFAAAFALPAGTSSITIAEGLLSPGETYELCIGSVNDMGNITTVERELIIGDDDDGDGEDCESEDGDDDSSDDDSSDEGGDTYSGNFDLSTCLFVPWGGNQYFSLEPGRVMHYEGEEDGTPVALRLTFTHDLRAFAFQDAHGHWVLAIARVVEEFETEDGELVEISRNYFARCIRNQDVYYFGEDVEDYEDGEVIGNEGAWLAGENGATPGVIMPGLYLLGSCYLQEQAPGVALDTATHVGENETVEVPAGVFTGCVRIDEGSLLEADARSEKVYAPGIGLIIDDELELVSIDTLD